MPAKNLRSGTATHERAANGNGESHKNGNGGRKGNMFHVVGAPAVSPQQAGGTLVMIGTEDAELFRWWREGLGAHYEVECASNLASLKQSLLVRKPSILLLDLQLPGLHGVSGVSVVSRVSPTTKTVVIRDPLEDREIVTALRGGARGHCAPHLDPYLMRKLVETVQKGEIWIRRSVVYSLVDGLRVQSEAPRVNHDGDPAIARLSAREREIANLVGGGARNKEIAARLSITETTVKAHLTAAFRKLGLPDRLHLALYMSQSHAGGTAAGM
jgi:DNA-binding NarL/FixJ family response regulator